MRLACLRSFPRLPRFRPLTLSRSLSLQLHTMPVLRREIALTPTERDVFDILKKTTEHYDLEITLRCAGGWVRDKLLGRHSDDIDVAIDTMLGATFAKHVNGYLESQGEEIHPVAVIETNPDQSKHLETARIKIHGVQIDLVNLRSETYTQHSRVPTMDFGTPSEDAYRRDLTINSMFYNIHQDLVEDFTENGFEDLREGWIRTPLPPLETFLDDPLRVLRAVRFAARFGFRLDGELIRAAMAQPVQDALKRKVSRERIGTEVDGMFNGPDPVMAVQHLVDLGLFEIVFLLPENCHVEGYPTTCLATMKAAFHLLQSKSPPWDKEERRLYLLAALLAPIQLLRGPHASGKGARHFAPATAHVIWEGLRWRNKDTKDVALLHEHTPDLLSLFHLRASTSGDERVELGIWVRQMKSLWKLGVALAPIFSMKESLPLEVDPMDYPLHEFVHSFQPEMGNGTQSADSLEAKRLQLCTDIETWMQGHSVQDAWQLRPLLDGKSLMAELGMQRGGPILGELLDLAVKWQLAHPTGDRADCLEFVKEAYKERVSAEIT